MVQIQEFPLDMIINEIKSNKKICEYLIQSNQTLTIELVNKSEQLILDRRVYFKNKIEQKRAMNKKRIKFPKEENIHHMNKLQEINFSIRLNSGDLTLVHDIDNYILSIQHLLPRFRNHKLSQIKALLMDELIYAKSQTNAFSPLKAINELEEYNAIMAIKGMPFVSELPENSGIIIDDYYNELEVMDAKIECNDSIMMLTANVNGERKIIKARKSSHRIFQKKFLSLKNSDDFDKIIQEQMDLNTIIDNRSIVSEPIMNKYKRVNADNIIKSIHHLGKVIHIAENGIKQNHDMIKSLHQILSALIDWSVDNVRMLDISNTLLKHNLVEDDKDNES
jgi:hypothetical protein